MSEAEGFKYMRAGHKLRDPREMGVRYAVDASRAEIEEPDSWYNLALVAVIDWLRECEKILDVDILQEEKHISDKYDEPIGVQAVQFHVKTGHKSDNPRYRHKRTYIKRAWQMPPEQNAMRN
jgi:hypothetical protein